MTELSQKGIYAIFNIINGKFYIGSTIQSFRKRWRRHKSSLNRIRHVNIHLQNAWRKYGAYNFKFIIIEIVENLEEILKREQFWIDELEVVKYGYNILPTAGNCAGRKISEVTRAKISAALKGRERTQEEKNNISAGKKGIKFTQQHMENYRIARCKNVYEITTPDGEIDICINYTKYAKKHALNQSCLGRVLNGKYSHYKGYTIRKIGIITGWVDGNYTWKPVGLMTSV